MLEGLVTLASANYYGGAIGDVLNRWAEFGAFSYALPFLLIFALIYGILRSMKVFGDNKAIDAIIALSVGLMALQFDFVPAFFAEIFPRLGVGLAVMLVVLILVGFFTDPSKSWMMYSFWGLAIGVVIIILVNTSGGLGWYSGYWWYENWPMVAFILFILGALGIIVGSANKESKDFKLGPFRSE